MEPAKSVLDHYLKIQAALAQDSLDESVAGSAAVMAKAIRDDSKKTFSSQVAQQAEALTKAESLAAAREAFKPLSQSLLRYLTESKVPAGYYREAFCPMAKASWLQTGHDIQNPYLGKAMLRCGQFKS